MLCCDDLNSEIRIEIRTRAQNGIWEYCTSNVILKESNTVILEIESEDLVVPTSIDRSKLSFLFEEPMFIAPCRGNDYQMQHEDFDLGRFIMRSWTIFKNGKAQMVSFTGIRSSNFVQKLFPRNVDKPISFDEYYNSSFSDRLECHKHQISIAVGNNMPSKISPSRCLTHRIEDDSEYLVKVFKRQKRIENAFNARDHLNKTFNVQVHHIPSGKSCYLKAKAVKPDFILRSKK